MRSWLPVPGEEGVERMSERHKSMHAESVRGQSLIAGVEDGVVGDGVTCRL